jgi:hypothetical protein
VQSGNPENPVAAQFKKLEGWSSGPTGRASARKHEALSSTQYHQRRREKKKKEEEEELELE